jgi:predicted RNase H-like HicB family nuclease
LGTIAQRSVMQYQIFVQNPSEKRFTASVVGIPACVAEGKTKEEALASVQLVLEEQLAHGEFVTLDLPSATGAVVDSSELGSNRRKGDFSSLPGCGVFKDDPTFDDFVDRMAEFRARFNTEAAE